MNPMTTKTAGKKAASKSAESTSKHPPLVDILASIADTQGATDVALNVLTTRLQSVFGSYVGPLAMTPQFGETEDETLALNIKEAVEYDLRRIQAILDALTI